MQDATNTYCPLSFHYT